MSRAIQAIYSLYGNSSSSEVNIKLVLYHSTSPHTNAILHWYWSCLAKFAQAFRCVRKQKGQKGKRFFSRLMNNWKRNRIFRKKTPIWTKQMCSERCSMERIRFFSCSMKDYQICWAIFFKKLMNFWCLAQMNGNELQTPFFFYFYKTKCCLYTVYLYMVLCAIWIWCCSANVIETNMHGYHTGAQW